MADREAALDADYDTRYTGVSTQYNCGLDGKCEKTHFGKYDSLEQCQANCTAAENKDLIYQILAYEPSSAEDLPPSGRIRVVKEMLGVKVSARKADRILSLFRVDDWAGMREEPLLDEYFRQLYTPLQLFARDIIACTCINTALFTDYTVIEQKVLPILQEYVGRYRFFAETGTVYEDESDIDYELAYVLTKLLLNGNFFDGYKGRVESDISELVGERRVTAIVESE